MSTLCGIVGLFTLPDYPHTKTGSQRWSMNHDQRLLAEARMEADRVTGSVARGGVLQGLKLALMNIKLYLFIILNTSRTCAYGFNFFFPILVEGLDLSANNIVALLLTAPTYFTAATVSFVVAWFSDRKKEGGYYIVIRQPDYS